MGMIGGTFAIAPRTGGGTVVSCSLPVLKALADLDESRAGARRVGVRLGSENSRSKKSGARTKSSGGRRKA
jgi:hypothetical protein